jgi:hypothetical protein
MNLISVIYIYVIVIKLYILFENTDLCKYSSKNDYERNNRNIKQIQCRQYTLIGILLLISIYLHYYKWMDEDILILYLVSIIFIWVYILYNKMYEDVPNYDMRIKPTKKSFLSTAFETALLTFSSISAGYINTCNDTI